MTTAPLKTSLSSSCLRLIALSWCRRRVVLAVCVLLLFTFFVLSLYVHHTPGFMRLSPRPRTRTVTWMREKGKVQEACVPRSNVAFLKNHKCASSAVQNILFRYAELHDLHLVLPDYGNYFGGGPRPFQATMFTGSQWSKLGANIYAIHTKWNHDEIAKIMPNNTVYLSIVREPTSLFISLYTYAHFEKRTGMTVEDFILNKAIDAPRVNGYLGFNQMTWDFGMPFKHINNLTAVEQMVREASDRFDLVMVAERMDESLVLLAHLMCWPLSQVIVLKLNARSSKYHLNMSDELLRVLQLKQAPDHLLYEHFLARFDALVEDFGRERMAREVARLRNLTEELMVRCKFDKKPSKQLTGINRPWSDMVEGYSAGNSTDVQCQRIATTELSYINLLRKKQQKEIIVRFGIPNDPRLHALNPPTAAARDGEGTERRGLASH